MKDLVLDLMDNSEDIDFILSRDTAYEVALALLDDDRVFEEMEEFEVIEEINNSVAVIVSQILTDAGYIYILENYLFDNGTAKGMDGTDLVVIEDEIEDLVDIDKVYSEDIVVVVSDEDSCEYECFEVGYEEGYNQALEDVRINTTCFTSGNFIVIKLTRS